MTATTPSPGSALRTDVLSVPLAGTLDAVFGRLSDPIEAVAERVERMLPGRRVIVWEGDAQTFAFSFVSASSEGVLGFPTSRWTSEPTFWADVVVHPDDRDDAVAFCALATGRGRDHDFVYRAITADGEIVWLHDVVRVVRALSGVPERLRGIMLDVTAEMNLRD